MAELVANALAFPRGRAEPAQASLAMSPKHLAITFRRNWGIILGFGLVFGGLGFVVSKTAITQKFTASGTLVVESQHFAIAALQGALAAPVSSDPMPQLHSETQILESRALVQTVVQALNLSAYPEFNGALRPPPLKARIGAAIGNLLPAPLAAPLVRLGILRPAHLPPPAPDVVLNNTVAAVQHNLSVTDDNRSLIITIEFISERPDLAARVVNTLIDRYMTISVVARANANREANVALEGRLADVRADVTRLERQIEATRKKYNLVQTRAGSVGQQELEDLSSALTRASDERAQLEANYERAAVLTHSGSVGIDNADALSSSIVGTLRDREATAERNVANLQIKLGPGHPTLLAAKAELASARAAVITEAQRVMAGLGAQASAARQREADLRGQLAAAQIGTGKLANVQGELVQLEKDADARRTVYQTLLQSAEQTSAKDNPEQANARVVSPAIMPLDPSSPRPKLAAILGMLSGFAFGGLVSAVARRHERTYADADEIVADTGLAAIAALPRIKSKTNSLADIVVTDPAGTDADALRMLRAQLRLDGNRSVLRSVMFAGSMPGEGSSTLAAAFARVAALDGLRVLLVEGDLQTPSLAGVLGVLPSSGLVKSLSGPDPWPESVTHDRATALDILLVGSPHPRASQLLESMQLRSLMAEAYEEYNLVVVDGQPISAGAHALTFANLVDAVILVVKANDTPRIQVRNAAWAIGGAARQPPVIVLNQVS